MLCLSCFLLNIIFLFFCFLFFFFFFSSRRRHTRFDCDWSSDVCSSDLSTITADQCGRRECSIGRSRIISNGNIVIVDGKAQEQECTDAECDRCTERSEERRVGKECRSRWSADNEKKKDK